MAMHYGIIAIYGTPQPRPFINVPEGAKLRLKLRAESVGIVYVRRGDTTTKHAIFPTGNNLMSKTWEIGFELGRNQRI